MNEIREIDQQVFEKIKKMLNDGNVPDITFTKAELVAIKEMAADRVALNQFGKMAKKWKTIFAYVGFFIGAWLAFKAGLADFLKGIMTGK